MVHSVYNNVLPLMADDNIISDPVYENIYYIM